MAVIIPAKTQNIVGAVVILEEGCGEDKSWVHDRAVVRNEDIVVWHTFGLTHNPRVEDFPVMPAEIAQVHLRPYNFCLFNPTNDVPPSSQLDNKSVPSHQTLVHERSKTEEGTNGCCATTA